MYSWKIFEEPIQRQHHSDTLFTSSYQITWSKAMSIEFMGLSKGHKKWVKLIER